VSCAACVHQELIQGLEKIWLKPPPEPQVLYLQRQTASADVKLCGQARIEVCVLRLVRCIVDARCRGGLQVCSTYSSNTRSSAGFSTPSTKLVPSLGLFWNAVDKHAGARVTRAGQERDSLRIALLEDRMLRLEDARKVGAAVIAAVKSSSHSPKDELTTSALLSSTTPYNRLGQRRC